MAVLKSPKNVKKKYIWTRKLKHKFKKISPTLIQKEQSYPSRFLDEISYRRSLDTSLTYWQS